MACWLVRVDWRQQHYRWILRFAHVILNAGDLLYIPAGWWHCATNVPPSEGCFSDVRGPQIPKILTSPDYFRISYKKVLTTPEIYVFRISYKNINYHEHFLEFLIKSIISPKNVFRNFYKKVLSPTKNQFLKNFV